MTTIIDMDSKMENRKDIIKKIMKLMARTTSRGATEAEAINATLIAQKMMNDYDIKQSELHLEEKELILDKECEINSTKSFYSSLAAVIAPNFRCRAYEESVDRKKHVHFYGYESDVEAANIIFKHLYTLGNRLANRKCREAKQIWGTATGVYNSFATGFINGVQSELEKQTMALLIVTPKEVNDKWDKDFADTNFRAGRSMTVNSWDTASYYEGRDAAINSIRNHRIEGRQGLPA